VVFYTYAFLALPVVQKDAPEVIVAALMRFLPLANGFKDQKIAAFGSSYGIYVRRGITVALGHCRSCRRLRSFDLAF